MITGVRQMERHTKQKSLWTIAVRIPSEAEEAIVELFTRLFGLPASSYSDVETGISTVTVYLEEKPRFSAAKRAEIAAGFERIRGCGLSVGHPRLSVKKLPRQDWAESWKRHFHPIEIGSTLLIKPSWSKRRPKLGQATIILDPGLSFGTGQHPTTAFCLRELVKRRGRDTAPYLGGKSRAKQSFLDIGTGSGILAIAAARLGYAPVDAFDFDPEAVRVASVNARRNRVSEKIHFSEQDVTKLSRTGPKYSVIGANLISNLLISARDRILARLAPGGVVVVAGIMNTEFHTVQRAYENAGLRLVASQVKKDWRSGSFARR
jgi:ribosomal protein L11 methyltransferase